MTTTRYNIPHRMLALLIRTVVRLNGGLEIKGRENIPLEGGVLVAVNHISYLDPPLIGAVLPRRATFMARKGLFEIPLLRRFMRKNAIPVNRQKPAPSTIKETIRRLKRGELMVIFPEGRRSETGELLDAKRGIGMIISMSGVPVVPAMITGSDRALPVDARWLKRARVSVIFGKPLNFPSPEPGSSDAHLMQEDISRQIMQAIRALKGSGPQD